MSPDGDVIDCVLSHLQPAFDHPQLKGQKPLKPPERPKGNDTEETGTEKFQSWTVSGESCPEGTIPIRRTTESDVLRASSVRGFGKKLQRGVRRDTLSSDHEHAVAFVNGDQYYGAKASINVWAPRVTDEHEFSLSQLWVISGTFGRDLNTIEAGPKARTLVARIRAGLTCRVLALILIHPLEKSRKYGPIRRRNSEHQINGTPHINPNG
ncbi:NEP-interacting protein, putative [Actinidia rufa]|uniref:NEP-interacting protein, putative n=1 Tax=Actinidia rufa TaxID=165716 RepID=A0A7J0GMI5_9ERIC|nr:NEP-interacting protein, putative [Actinidia rufa]